MTITERQQACDNHGILKDGLFRVICRDKTGQFLGGAPGLPSSQFYDLANSVLIAKHMASFGYRLVKYPPGLLTCGEMVIARI